MGLRNHKFFMWFLINSELTCLYGAVLMIVLIVKEVLKEVARVTLEHSFDYLEVVIKCFMSLVFLIICTGFAFPIFNLIVYHVSIVFLSSKWSLDST